VALQFGGASVREAAARLARHGPDAGAPEPDVGRSRRRPLDLVIPWLRGPAGLDLAPGERCAGWLQGRTTGYIDQKW